MLDNNLRSIGNKLLTFRKRLGMTQLEVAEATGLSDRTYANIERGCVNMRIDTLLRICDVMHITPNDILTSDPPVFSHTQSDLLAQLDECSYPEKETALRLLEVYFHSINKA